MPKVTSQAPLTKGISPYSRSAKYHTKGINNVIGKSKTPAKTEKKKKTTYTVTKKLKNGKTVEVQRPRAPRWYPTEPIRRKLANHKAAPKPVALRPSITPGTVLILLAGRFAGRRVVFLKQLPSGLLLITGPFKLNGVPLRRVNQRYVIATSTKIDISGVTVPETINDRLFTKKANKKAAAPVSKEEAFFAKSKKQYQPLPAEFKNLQKQVDAALLTEVKKTPLLAKYLSTRFSLNKNQYPHLMKF